MELINMLILSTLLAVSSAFSFDLSYAAAPDITNFNISTRQVSTSWDLPFPTGRDSTNAIPYINGNDPHDYTWFNSLMYSYSDYVDDFSVNNIVRVNTFVDNYEGIIYEFDALNDSYVYVNLEQYSTGYIYVNVVSSEQSNTSFKLNLRLYGLNSPVDNYYSVSHSFLKPIDSTTGYRHDSYSIQVPYYSDIYGESFSNSRYMFLALNFNLYRTDTYVAGLVESAGDNYDSAFNNGYSAGYSDGYSNGNTNGYQDGFDVGNTSGYSTGYGTGYSEGYSAGSQESNSFINLFGAVADTPVIMLYRLFNFDLFGTSVIVIVLTLFTAIVLIGVIRKFLK